jgi:hypothetical protein
MRPLRTYTPPPKYGNRKVAAPDGGKPFDSAAEARRWGDLQLLQRAGQITELQRQVRYQLVPSQRDADGKAVRPVHYVADFRYRDTQGRDVVEDVKGVATPVYRLKRALMLMCFGITIKEVRV